MVSRVSIPKNSPIDLTKKGPWWAPIDNEDAPLLACACGVRRLMSNHSIAEDGTVHPSIACTDCDYHVWGKLKDWPGSSAPSP